MSDMFGISQRINFFSGISAVFILSISYCQNKNKPYNRSMQDSRPLPRHIRARLWDEPCFDEMVAEWLECRIRTRGTGFRSWWFGTDTAIVSNPHWPAWKGRPTTPACKALQSHGTQSPATPKESWTKEVALAN